MIVSPVDIARARVHKARQAGTCASDDRRLTPRPPCNCDPTPELADAWDGRARMAKARLDGRRMISFVDEKLRTIDDDGNETWETVRRWYIETDLDKILDEHDKEALRRKGISWQAPTPPAPTAPYPPAGPSPTDTSASPPPNTTVWWLRSPPPTNSPTSKPNGTHSGR